MCNNPLNKMVEFDWTFKQLWQRWKVEIKPDSWLINVNGNFN